MGVPLSFAITGPTAEAIGHDATLIWAGAIGGTITLAFMFVQGARGPERDGSLRSIGAFDHTGVNSARGVHARRSARAGGLSSLPRHDELRAPHAGGRVASHHGRGDRRGHQLLRHGQRVRAASRRGLDRADHRRLVREGRRPAGEGRAGHQGLRADGRLAERVTAVEARDPPGVRGLAAAPADRLHRHLSDAPHRPERVVERDLGGDGSAQERGQDPLRRVVELRRVAHRRGRTRSPASGTRSDSPPSSPSTT